MAWDASRPIPWQRLVREWLIYVAIMAAVFLIFMRDRPLAGIFLGLIVSGPLYLAFGAVLAKFGYTRKTLKQLREETPQKSSKASRGAAEPDPSAPRPKPAATKRTGGGTSGRPGGQRSKRR